MDDQGFGAYKFYFKLLRNFGAFPFRIEYPGTKLGYHHSGLFKWLYYFNFIAVVFGCSFQFAQLMLSITYAPDPINVIAQLCWMFAMCIPLANMLAFIQKEDRIVSALDNWCHLERSIIANSIRGVNNMNKGPMPTMSACHQRQTRLFRKTSAIYCFMGLIVITAMTLQVIEMPRFPAYVYTIMEVENDVLRYISTGYQIWLVILIWIHVYATEVFYICAAGSITHCIENLSYKGSVVMANRQCDVPNLNEVLIKNWAAFEGKSKSGSAIGTQSEKIGSGDSRKDSSKNSKAGYNQETYYLAHVVQNVVDIQYALDRYKDVEGIVDSLNVNFGPMLFNHMSVYMSLMCTIFYTPIRYGSIIPMDGSLVFSAVALTYLVRLFLFFPSMGRIHVLSQKFTESWMEGLRHIPKGKYAYEFYMHKLESCRKLSFDAGGFYLMQKGTVLTFVSIVTTHIIVLLQLY